MKIIKNLKYFLMLGCLSFATFTFAETAANQDADKQAVQKQLSKKLNDLSIHIETLENMLKVINVNDWNGMKNRLDSFDTSISNLYSEIEKLPDNLENIFCNGTPDLMNGYVIESGAETITYGANLTTVVNYRKWSNGYLEQFCKNIIVGGDSEITMNLPIAYESIDKMWVQATRTSNFDVNTDAGVACVIETTNSLKIINGTRPNAEGAKAFSLYVHGYIDVNAELEKPHRHMHGYVVDAGIIEQDHDGDPNNDPRKVMYRKWNDGWLEQHGMIKVNSAHEMVTVSFPYEYKDRELMNIQLSESRLYPDGYVLNMLTTNITTSGFSIEFDMHREYNKNAPENGRYYFWKAEGYIDNAIELKNTCDSMYRYVCDTYEYKNEETGEVKWYRKWSDGWLEQGGTLVQTNGSNTVLIFDVPYEDTSYTFTATSNGKEDNNTTYDFAYASAYNKKPEQLSVVLVKTQSGQSPSVSDRLVNYYSCGKAASTTE